MDAVPVHRLSTEHTSCHVDFRMSHLLDQDLGTVDHPSDVSMFPVFPPFSPPLCAHHFGSCGMDRVGNAMNRGIPSIRYPGHKDTMTKDLASCIRGVLTAFGPS
jgi:hypothetical protein